MIAAVGRLRASPEAALCADYMQRAQLAGRGIGLYPFELREVEARMAGDREREADLLLAALPSGARLVLLDERGESWPSHTLANKLARWRDDGCPAAAFLIGGPDGHSPALRNNTPDLLAFGAQTWPHRLVRVMLAEQLYRAVTILGNTPYHRQ